MIFHTVHCHSLCLKSLVWVEYQLYGFHGNKSRRQSYVNKQNDFHSGGGVGRDWGGGGNVPIPHSVRLTEHF